MKGAVNTKQHRVPPRCLCNPAFDNHRRIKVFRSCRHVSETCGSVARSCRARSAQGINVLVLRAGVAPANPRPNPMKLNRSSILCTLALSASGAALGAPFTYNNNDLLLAFHKTGAPDLEVNIGSIFNYSTASTTLLVGGYSNGQLTAAFGSSLDGVSWSVIGASRVGQGGSVPANTLWLSRPRLDPNVASLAYDRKTSSNQGAVSAVINGVAGNGSIAGATLWSSGTPSDPVFNTTTAVVIPSSDPNSYTSLAGTFGNLNNTFAQGPIDNTVVGGTAATRSDLFEVTPGSGKGTYLGSFELRPSGSLVFTPVVAVPEPGTLALAGLGAVFLIGTLRRQNRS